MTRSDQPHESQPGSGLPGELSSTDEGLLVDLLRGEIEAEQAQALRGRLADEPVLAAAHKRLDALFAFEQARGVEHDSSRATRMAARIIDQVRASEKRAERARAARPRTRRLSWRSAILASLALNGLALGFIVFSMPGAEDEPKGDRFAFVHDYDSPFGNLGWESPEERLRRLQLEEPTEFERIVAKGLLDDGETAVQGGPTVVDIDLPQSDGLVHHPRSRCILVKGDSFKHRRLAGLGRDSESTLGAVKRGLTYLATRQRSDGHFVAEGGRSDIEQTARALLPFLGEGTSSRDRDSGSPQETPKRVVRKGIAWLRANTFADGAVRPGLGADSVDVALIALSEDYTLSFGRLPAAQAEDRAREIELLAEHIRARSSTDAPLVWSAWALDAAARTGVIKATASESTRFGSWVAAASGNDDPSAASDPLGALTQGSALRFLERGAAKPRLKSWMEETTDQLIGRLLPNGQAKTGEKIGDTALILLALQVAYRGY